MKMWIWVVENFLQITIIQPIIVDLSSCAVC
jgi:hypothetical protein